MRTLVIGDIHGSYRALLQCLERSNFDKEKDLLITLGDICDGWSEVYECVEELLTIKNRIDIKGNHDQWFYEFLRTGIHGSQWQQGGIATCESYGKRDMIIPETHERFFGCQMRYHLDEQNRCFVHGGFNRHLPLDSQDYEYIYWWDRDLWGQALSSSYRPTENQLKYPLKMVTPLNEVYIGHTSTGNWKKSTPMKAGNIWNLDTGAGFEGKLTIMDIDSKEFWQSDFCKELYPNERGRN